MPVNDHEFILKSTEDDTSSSENDANTVKINAEPWEGKEVDWRGENVMNPIREQMSCGSCWAFSSIAAIESRNAIMNGDLFKLSEQELIDCDTTNMGCDGGLPDKAFRWAIDHNLVFRDTCPYQAAQTNSCCSNIHQAPVQIEDYTVISNDVQSMREAITEGPIANGIRVNAYLQHYGGGIIEEADCPAPGNDINHAVNVVGVTKN